MAHEMAQDGVQWPSVQCYDKTWATLAYHWVILAKSTLIVLLLNMVTLNNWLHRAIKNRYIGPVITLN